MSLSESLDYFYGDMSDDPYWTESSWFSWAIPEQKICGFFYNHFRPNMSCMLGGPAMWDPSGRHVWDFLYFDWQTMRALPAGQFGVDYNKYDFVTPWSMSIKMLEPLKSYHLKYDREGFRLDLVFTAIAPPNIMKALTPEQLKQAFKVHFEQPGRIKGTVELDGRQYHVDCFSIRDGGHGPRFLENSPPGGYAWSTADEKNGWHLLAPNARTRVTKALAGYLLRDGEIAPIVDGSRAVLEREGPRPSVVEIRARDALERELHAIGRIQAPVEFMLFPDRGQWWSLCQWEYDGFTEAVGEDQEYYGIHELRRWHRAGADAWSKR